MDLKPGDKAPGFKLAVDGGSNISLSSLKGQPLILYFYPRDDTTGCTKEAVDFSKNLKNFEKLRVNVVGISKDSVASHDRFKTKYRLRHMLASDPNIEVAQAYGVWGEKTLYGRKYMGMERATFLVNAKGVIAMAWHKVKVPGHVEVVLEAAKSL